MIRRSLGALAALAMLAACDVPAPGGPDVIAGSVRPAPGVAAGLFQAVCVDNQLDLSAAPATLAGLPFTRNTVEDIYYHDSLNLSFKITPRGDASAICSMVWAPNQPAASYQQALRQVAPDHLFLDPENGLYSAGILGLY